MLGAMRSIGRPLMRGARAFSQSVPKNPTPLEGSKQTGQAVKEILSQKKLVQSHINDAEALRALRTGILQRERPSSPNPTVKETIQEFEKNRETLNQRDIMWCIMHAEAKRDGMPMPKNQTAQGRDLRRYDDFPNDSVSQNLFQSPKSHVSSSKSIIPTGEKKDFLAHLEGRSPEKDKSAFTSFVDKNRLSKHAEPIVKGWGQYEIRVDQHDKVWTTADVQRELRFSIGGWEVAKNKDGTKWLMDQDPMFKDNHELIGHIKEKMKEFGLNPEKTEFSRVEKAQIFNLALEEHLVEGPTSKNSVSVRRLPAE